MQTPPRSCACRSVRCPEMQRAAVLLAGVVSRGCPGGSWSSSAGAASTSALAHGAAASIANQHQQQPHGFSLTRLHDGSGLLQGAGSGASLAAAPTGGLRRPASLPALLQQQPTQGPHLHHHHRQDLWPAQQQAWRQPQVRLILAPRCTSAPLAMINEHQLVPRRLSTSGAALSPCLPAPAGGRCAGAGHGGMGAGGGQQPGAGAQAPQPQDQGVGPAGGAQVWPHSKEGKEGEEGTPGSVRPLVWRWRTGSRN